MNLKLYYTPRTRAVRVRWLLEELGLSYELVNIELFDGEGQTETYKKIHPLGCVPALDVDGEIVYESGAICDWLTDYFKDSNMAPPINSELRMKYKQWFYFVVATMEPHAWNIVLHKSIRPEKERITDIVSLSEKRYSQCLSVIEKVLTGQEYLIGEEFTTADIMLSSLLNWLPNHVRPFKNTYAYMNKIYQRDAYKLAIS